MKHQWVPAAVLALFTAVTVAYTWPLVGSLGTIYLMPTKEVGLLQWGDLGLTSWIVTWDAHALRTQPFHVFDANIMYPLPHTLAFADHMLGVGLLVLPLDILHSDAIVNHNVAVLASFAIGATGVALLVRELGGSIAAGLVAGALFAFAPLRLNALGELQQLSTEWMPFGLLFLHRLFGSGGWGAAIGFTVFFCLAALTSVYHFYYFSVMVAFWVLYHVVTRRPVAPRAHRLLVGAGLAAAVVLLPTFIPYVRLREVFVLARLAAHSVSLSADVEAYLGALLDPAKFLHQRYVERTAAVKFLGFGTLILLIAGLSFGARGRGTLHGNARLYGTLAVSMALLSLGPVMHMSLGGSGIPGPSRLLAWIPGFAALRTPNRAGQLALLALAIVAGLGADRLLWGFSSRVARVLGAMLVVGAVVADCWRPNLYVVPAPGADPIPAVHRWLAKAPDGPMVELPFKGPDREAIYMIWSTHHWKRMVNGYSGFSPAGGYLHLTLYKFPDAKSLRLLRALGVRYVVLHPWDMQPLWVENCSAPRRDAQPYLVVRYHDGGGCVLEVLGAPAELPRPVDRRVDLRDARFTSSAGGDPQVLADPIHAVRWVQAVDRDTPGWLRIDFPEMHVITRLVLRFGRHFGDHPRALRIAASADGVSWATAMKSRLTEAPLISFLQHPDDITMEIAIPPTPSRHLRLERPTTRNDLLSVYDNWHQWGAERIEVYEKAVEPGPAAH